MPRFSLRTPLILLAVGPMVLAVGYFLLIRPKPQTSKGPIVYAARFVGNHSISDKSLNRMLGFHGPADGGIRLGPTFAKNGVRQIEQWYLRKGLSQPTVTLLEGGQPGDKQLAYEIRENGGGRR